MGPRFWGPKIASFLFFFSQKRFSSHRQKHVLAGCPNNPFAPTCTKTCLVLNWDGTKANHENLRFDYRHSSFAKAGSKLGRPKWARLKYERFWGVRTGDLSTSKLDGCCQTCPTHLGPLGWRQNVKTITCKRPFNGGNRAEYFSLQCAEVFCDTLISERYACRNLEVTFNDLQVCSQWKRMKKLDSWICAQLASVSRSTDYVQPCHCLPPRTPISMLFKRAWQPTKSILSAAT